MIQMCKDLKFNSVIEISSKISAPAHLDLGECNDLMISPHNVYINFKHYNIFSH